MNTIFVVLGYQISTTAIPNARPMQLCLFRRREAAEAAFSCCAWPAPWLLSPAAMTRTCSHSNNVVDGQPMEPKRGAASCDTGN